MPVPAQSLAAKQDKLIDGRKGLDLAEGIWLRENVREMTIFADNYDFVISLLLLPNSGGAEWREDETEDIFDRFNSQR